ncbi:MAG: hypothetical protein AAF799_46020 [Myxococcota bacterium]
MSRAEFSPEQLDRLEDALEGLEDELFEPAADDPVDERLVEFREILELSREALPMEDVPSGLLDGVMAEARQAAANGAPAAAAEGSWWSRLTGGAWLPTLAFAGSAALLLVMLWPSGAEEAEESAVAKNTANESAKAESAPPAAAKPADSRLADASASSEPSGDAFRFEQTQRGAGAAAIGGAEAPGLIAEDKPEPEPEADDAQPEAPSEEPAVAREPKKEPSKRAASKGKKSAGGIPGGIPGGVPSSGSKGGGYPSAPASKPKPKPKGGKESGKDLMSDVVEGDSLRRSGRCGLAEMRYAKARKSNDDSIRARALAGLGLCKELEGSMGPAKKLYAQARAADPSVSSFIQREQGRMPPQPAPDEVEEAVEEEASEDAPVKE